MLALSTYFTGKPCKFGHSVERFTVNGDCQECSRLKSSARYHENPEAHAKKIKIWQAANKEKRKEISRNYARRNRGKYKDYVENNKDKVRGIKSRWKSKNKEATNSHTRNRRAKLRGAKGKHTKIDILALHEQQCGKCANCRISLENGYHVDHKNPISKGGSNDPANLQLLCPSCNCRKSNKDYRAWLAENNIVPLVVKC